MSISSTMDSRLVLALSLAVGLFFLLCLLVWPRPERAEPEDDTFRPGLMLASLKASNDDPSRPCNHYDGDGCSIPFGLPFFFKKQFTRSCDRHDVCYHCGVDYNVNRQRCDTSFRQDTLATCKFDYMALDPLSSRHNIVRATNASHEARVLKALEEHGTGILVDVLIQEISVLRKTHPELTLKVFENWFANHETQVRMLAEWVIDLAQYLKRHGEKSEGPLKMSQVDLHRIKKHAMPLRSTMQEGYVDNSIIEYDWCADVKNYLKAHKKTLPPSAGIVCPDISYLTCNFFSEVYYLAVRIFAYIYYLQTAEFYCRESWVPKCLPNQTSTTLRFAPGQRGTW